MPKIITEAERKLVRDAIYDSTISLIKQKGIRKVTVDDITTAVGISKGSFYSYYPSKEVCLYKVLKRSEEESFTRMESILAQDLHDKERIIQFLHEVFLSSDSIILHLSPTDFEVLMRKLPLKYREREQKKSEDHFQRSLKLLKTDINKMETVAMLTDCLSIVASNNVFTEKGKQETLDILIMAIANYLSEENIV